ncbi:Glutamate receptor ionotropic, NMDA 3A [Nymphon striatum]|nr:Glutamate receptor ionotropic, NMDA 3A [Nymphon striatum]
MQDEISTLLIKYSATGHIDALKEKWYGDMPCFERGANILRPQALTPSAVAGVFMVLGCGFFVGFVILIFEHFVFKYSLPILRKKSKTSFWKSPNLMFFSQKLYRFINCVELVSPHHSAKEIASHLKAGQIFSLFQKSVKRKAKEDARRRKSKSLFFDMILEVTRKSKQNELPSEKKQSIDRRDSRESWTSEKRRRVRLAEIELTGDSAEPIEELRVPTYENENEDISEQSYLLNRRGILKNSTKPNELEVATSSKRSRLFSVEEFLATNPTSFSLNDISTTNKEQFGNKFCPKHNVYEAIPCVGRNLSDSNVLYQTQREQPLEPNVTICNLGCNQNNQGILAYQPPIDEFKIKVMDKETIVKMWLESDYRLRKELQKSADEKKALESKLIDLKKLIRKPP